MQVGFNIVNKTIQAEDGTLYKFTANHSEPEAIDDTRASTAFEFMVWPYGEENNYPNEDELTCKVEIIATISNPLIITSIAIYAAKVYGMCIGAQVLLSAGGHLQRCYKESKKNQKEVIGLLDRFGDIIERFSQDDEQMEIEIKKSFKECATDITKNIIYTGIAI